MYGIGWTFSTMSQETWFETILSTVNGTTTVTIQDTSRVAVGMAVYIGSAIDAVITEITSPTEFTVDTAATSYNHRNRRGLSIWGFHV